MQTVNIIKYYDSSCTSIAKLVSFPDTPAGNKAAEGLFVRWVSNTEATMPVYSLEDALSDGYYTETKTGQTIVCVHSTEEIDD